MIAFGCQAIAGIAESWEQITLDIGPYKDRGHFRLKYVLIIQEEWKKNNSFISELTHIAMLGLVQFPTACLSSVYPSPVTCALFTSNR